MGEGLGIRGSGLWHEVYGWGDSVAGIIRVSGLNVCFENTAFIQNVHRADARARPAWNHTRALSKLTEAFVSPLLGLHVLWV